MSNWFGIWSPGDASFGMLTGMSATTSPSPPAGAIYALLAGQVILALLVVLLFVVVMFMFRRMRIQQETRAKLPSPREDASGNEVDAWLESARRLDDSML